MLRRRLNWQSDWHANHLSSDSRPNQKPRRGGVPIHLLLRKQKQVDPWTSLVSQPSWFPASVRDPTSKKKNQLTIKEDIQLTNRLASTSIYTYKYIQHPTTQSKTSSERRTHSRCYTTFLPSKVPNSWLWSSTLRPHTATVTISTTFNLCHHPTWCVQYHSNITDSTMGDRIWESSLK